MALPKIVLIDDTQHVARQMADWSALEGRAELTILHEPFADEDAAARALEPFEIIVPMRERTPFPASLIERLPRLKLFSMTGPRAGTFDLSAFARQGVIVCNSGSLYSGATTAELTFALILASARDLPRGDATMRSGGWHEGVVPGALLEGKRLGLLGLGKIGARVARYAQAFGMKTVAWSQNLTPEAAALHGAEHVDKQTLFATSDFVSLHLVLSPRSRAIVGPNEIAFMKPGATLVNTARGPLVDQEALLRALEAGSIRAALDVYDEEPLPPEHAFRRLPNVVMTPHLGYAAEPVMRQFYGEALENILAYLAGAPVRVVNPEATVSR